MLRSLTTNLLYHGKIKTTETRAKEVRKLAERLITLAVKERDNFDEVTVKAKIARKNVKGERIKETVNNKKVTVYDEIDMKIKKDRPSRLIARRKMLSVFYPVTEVPKDGRAVRSSSKAIDMPKRMFEEIAPKYVDRRGGYTRMVKLDRRVGDGAEMVIIELV
jgi:large subunit ribosomal protein L17